MAFFNLEIENESNTHVIHHLYTEEEAVKEAEKNQGMVAYY